MVSPQHSIFGDRSAGIFGYIFSLRVRSTYISKSLFKTKRINYFRVMKGSMSVMVDL